MRILICGDRDWETSVRDPWGTIYKALHGFPEDTVIIHGNCRGADEMAAHTAEVLGFQVIPFPADWQRYGGHAGPIRNSQMLREGKPDRVIAFHPNISKSRGTKNMVRQATAAGVPVEVITE